MRLAARPPLYGLDIETDTSTDGLDPGVAAIVAVALSCQSSGDIVLTGSEAGILGGLDAWLAEAEPGLVVTWNGGAFDLPFLLARSRAAGVELGLELAWDPSGYRVGRTPLPGHLGTYVAAWYGHGHLDAYRAWRHFSDPEVSCALKAVAKSLELEPVEVGDAAHIHEIGLDELRRYVSSDASLARRLADLRWGDVRRFVDSLPAGGQLALG